MEAPGGAGAYDWVGESDGLMVTAVPRRPCAMQFLKENWPWIVFPIVLFAAAVAALVIFGGGDPLDQHQYNL